jgi:hypothetical protein
MVHLRARNVHFDGVVEHSRVEELIQMRFFDMSCHRVCQVVRRSHKPYIGKLELFVGLASNSDLDRGTLLSQRIVLRDRGREKYKSVSP